MVMVSENGVFRNGKPVCWTIIITCSPLVLCTHLHHLIERHMYIWNMDTFLQSHNFINYVVPYTQTKAVDPLHTVSNFKCFLHDVYFV